MAEDPSRSDTDDTPVDDWVAGRTPPASGDDETDVDSEDDGWTAPLGTGGEADDRSVRDGSDGPDGDEDGDDPYAPEPNSTPVEPGAPSLENAAFVLLGALAMVAVILRMVSLGFG